MSSSLVNLDISKDEHVPKNIEAEQTILGSILANNEIFDEVTDQLDESYFFDPIHQKIYKIIENLISKGLLANPVTIKNFFNSKEELIEIGGIDYLVKLTKVSTTKNQIKYYKMKINRLAIISRHGILISFFNIHDRSI